MQENGFPKVSHTGLWAHKGASNHSFTQFPQSFPQPGHFSAVAILTVDGLSVFGKMPRLRAYFSHAAPVLGVFLTISSHIAHFSIRFPKESARPMARFYDKRCGDGAFLRVRKIATASK
ncbi:MAG: hypothetical protein E7644_00730 [Ruminococcaceae bacterium]|nr:hypothetical protein [Oscillospiraceae bacterium]